MDHIGLRPSGWSRDKLMRNWVLRRVPPAIKRAQTYARTVTIGGRQCGARVAPNDALMFVKGSDYSVVRFLWSGEIRRWLLGADRTGKGHFGVKGRLL